MEDYSAVFNRKLYDQSEACARKALESLQKDLQGPQKLTPEEIYRLAKAAESLLFIRNTYGKK
jgi:hypothetical protein